MLGKQKAQVEIIEGSIACILDDRIKQERESSDIKECIQQIETNIQEKTDIPIKYPFFLKILCQRYTRYQSLN